MANTSILAAFERMWQHVVAVVANKADTNHTHTASEVGAVPTNSGWGGNLGSYPSSDWDTISGTVAKYMTSDANNKPSGVDHCMWQIAYSDSWKEQFACDYRKNIIQTRGFRGDTGAWNSWATLMPMAGCGTEDIVAGSTPLADGHIYIVYE